MHTNTRAKVTNEQIHVAIENKSTISAVREALGNIGSPNCIQLLLVACNDRNKLADLLERERSAAVATQL